MPVIMPMKDLRNTSEISDLAHKYQEPIFITRNGYRDFTKEAYYYDAVLWAVEKGITAGLYPDQFAPNATCTRGQVVSFIFRTGQWEVDQLKIVFPR